MNMKKPLPDRKRLRMQTFDYAKNGMYYVTLCTHNREKLLADVVNVGTDPRVRPNAAGRMVEKKLHAVEEKFSNVTLDCYCVMPNHIHAVFCKWAEPSEDGHMGPSLQELMQWLKTQTTNEYIKMVRQGILEPFDKHVWQRSYFEHVVRGDNDLYEIRKYIQDNPAKWVSDDYYG